MSKKLIKLSASLIIASCTTSSPQVSLELDPMPANITETRSLEAQLKSLEDDLNEHSDHESLVADVKFQLMALIEESRGQHEQASKYWISTLDKSPPEFALRRFNRFLRAFAKAQPSKVTPINLAQKLLNEPQEASLSLFLKNQNFTDLSRLKSHISKEVPGDFLLVDEQEREAPKAPKTLGIPPDDPTLAKTAQIYCQNEQNLKSEFTLWRKSLTADVESYFSALVYQCKGDWSRAVSTFSDVAPQLKAKSNTVHLAVEAFERIIKLRRDQGERETVAPVYLSLMDAWKDPGLSPASFGILRESFEQKRIDDILWATRARAGVGDEENTRKFAEEGIVRVHFVTAAGYQWNSEKRTELLGQAAEAYNILAFRLGVESRNWEQAIRNTEKALEISGLSPEWQFRLRWNLGLYHYLDGRLDEARLAFEEILSELADPRNKPMLLYWLGRIHREMNHETESKVYAELLTKEFPLSYYSVVPSFGDQAAWLKDFKQYQNFRQALKKWQRGTQAFRKDVVISSKIKRAEILISLKLGSYANETLDEVQKYANSNWSEKEQLESWVYLSRLYAASGNWLNLITLTAKLSRDESFWKTYPEQILLFYPFPYHPSFISEGENGRVKLSVLLAIARQESSFKVDARSPANAWGLMQLTVPTAKRLAQTLDRSVTDSWRYPDVLTDPRINLQLGRQFLGELFVKYEDFLPAVAGAYNAGVSTMDQWMARRNFDDLFIYAELIPYQETRDYIKAVLRNQAVYEFLLTNVYLPKE